MLQEFADIRAAQGKLDMVDGICAQLEALDAKLSEQTARLDQVQMKVKPLSWRQQEQLFTV